MVHKIPLRGSFSALNHHLYARWKSSHWADPFHKLLIDITTVFHHSPLALRKVTAEPCLFSCMNQLHVNTEILSLTAPPPDTNTNTFPLPLKWLTLFWHNFYCYCNTAASCVNFAVACVTFHTNGFTDAKKRERVKPSLLLKLHDYSDAIVLEGDCPYPMRLTV